MSDDGITLALAIVLPIPLLGLMALLDLHGDLQAVIGRAAGNRIAADGNEDWSMGGESDG